MRYVSLFFRDLVIFLIIAGFAVVFLNNRVLNSGSDVQSLKADPANLKLRFGYALQLLKQKEYGQAQKQLEIAYEFDKKNVYINSALQKTLLNSPEIQIEIKKTLKTLARRPDYASAWLHLASLYETIGDMDKADLAKQAGEQLRTI